MLARFSLSYENQSENQHLVFHMKFNELHSNSSSVSQKDEKKFCSEIVCYFELIIVAVSAFVPGLTQ